MSDKEELKAVEDPVEDTQVESEEVPVDDGTLSFDAPYLDLFLPSYPSDLIY